MRMALKGQTTAQAAQPVQAWGACSSAVFFQCRACRLSTRGSQAATQRPQPVQRAALTSGCAGLRMGGTAGLAGMPRA